MPQPNRTEPLPDGIYIGLHEDRYHADSALGSTDIRNCLKGPNVYWHGSSFNPNKPKNKMTEARVIGKAMHKLLLEGSSEFRSIYVRRPDDDEDATPAEKSAATKAAKKKILEDQFLLKGPDFDFILSVKAIIDSDPELCGCLENGLPEVSVFWTRKDGTRLKCRFDMLKLRGYGDIKSIANERNLEMGSACRYAIMNYRYDIQIEHYNEGRRELVKLATKSLFFFGTSHVSEVPKNQFETVNRATNFINKVAAQETFAAQFVFVPKLGNDGPGEKAPDAWSCVISPANPILKISRDDIETALMIYRDAMKFFGPDNRWLPGRAVSELAIEEMPFGLSRRAA